MLPVFLLLIFGGIDFGRVFLGWINLNNTARIAANYAASNAVELNSGDPVAVATYNKLVTDDATATNCTPPTPLPPPTYTPNTDLGSNATVQVSCSFKVFTPIISAILGNHVTVSSSAVFPIRKGVIAGVPTGGGPAPAVAGFTVSPLGGMAPQTMTFTNTSTGPIVTYAWDFDGDGVTDYSTDGNPPPWIYSVPGTYHPSLTVSNGVTPDTATKTIVITTPPGPVADFTFTLSSPNAPSTVTFTNTSTGNPTTYAWKFGDGTTSIVKSPPSKSYPAGTWTVELKVTNAIGTSTTIKTFTVLPPILMCTVPDFKNLQTDVLPSIQSRWQGAGFSTTVIFNPARPPEYKISPKQSPKAGTSQPCLGTVMTVSDK